MKSSDPAHIKKVEEKYEALYGIEQGGVTYIKISLGEMFDMCDVVITSLQELFKKFSWDGVSKYPSENMALLVHKINAVA